MKKAKRLIRKKQGCTPRVTVTDKLRSHATANM